MKQLRIRWASLMTVLVLGMGIYLKVSLGQLIYRSTLSFILIFSMITLIDFLFKKFAILNETSYDDEYFDEKQDVPIPSKSKETPAVAGQINPEFLEKMNSLQKEQHLQSYQTHKNIQEGRSS